MFIDINKIETQLVFNNRASNIDALGVYAAIFLIF